MKQHPPVLIANNNGYGSVPKSIPMRLKLGCRSDWDIIRINDDNFI